MRNQVAIRWARKPWLAALLLVALGSRLLIPTGFMPGPGGLVLCTGHGPMSAMDTFGMDMSQNAVMPGQGGHAEDHEFCGVCPFSAAAVAMAAPTAASLSLRRPFESTDISLPPQPCIAHGTIVPSRLPRGPPSDV